ncbi:threonine--tRNA ligase [Buchnera aphidicola (Pseudoregma panicola)]|uniref:threonine--tRNA ligase n=1 Tax=Buchnera aphidicola TaxID=9 RepID=UPI0031B7259E
MSLILCVNNSNKLKKKKNIKNLLRNIKFRKNEFCIAYKIKNKLYDITNFAITNKKVSLITNMNKKEFLNIIQNSCIQLLCHAVKKLWPETKSATSGFIRGEFYCDFEMKKNLTKHSLSLVFNKMKELCKSYYSIRCKKISVDRLIKIFSSYQENYQVFILKNNFKNKKKLINIYFHNNYLVFIPGIQINNIKFFKNFFLTRFSGVYWNSKKNNKVLQRIYGVVFSNKKELLNNINKNIDLNKYDHRKLGAKLNLYHIDKRSPGMIFWHENGFIIFELLKKFLRKYLSKYGYKEVITPIIMNKGTWKRSGHFKSYKEHIFNTISENKDYCIKPMNCPGHIKIFNETIRSYRDLPIRLSEFGICHRNEYSGSLHGLMRTRSFTQDDAHIFCRKSQFETEINKCINMIFDVYKIFNFRNIKIYFSTRPKNSIGDDSTWDLSQKILYKILKNNNINFKFKYGDGAFYGPKIEFVLEDRLYRNWQCGTIQLDFYIAKRLKVFYINKYNIKKNPIIIHRAILGSIERFIGILLEECYGNLPLWISPIQIVIISVSEKHKCYVKNVFNKLVKNNFRVIYDINNVTISSKIRKYSTIKIPYILICGDIEINSSSLTVRDFSGKITNKVFIKDFIKEISKKNILL